MISRLLPFLAVVSGLFATATPMLAVADPWEERPPRIIQTTDVQFPHDLLASGVSEGEVRALLMIDANGKLLDCLLTAFTHRELGQVLMNAVRHWAYEPAMERGVAVGQRFEIMFLFRSTGSILSQIPSNMLAASLNRRFKAPLTQLVCKPSELDRKPVVLESVSPAHPGKSLKRPELKGNASIDFYIDAEGRPRMPVATRGSNEDFAIAAADALLQWRFEPPTSNGKPVMVRIVQEFIF
jgi:TonB family protein